MRTWRLLFAVGLLAALLVPAGSASAKPHETIGSPHSECVVNGEVELSGHDDNGTEGLDNNKSEGEYNFSQTDLLCAGQFLGTWNVEAEGGTTDLWHGNEKKDPDNNENGEDCEQGGSDKVDADGDGIDEELHSGTLDASAKDPSNPDFNGKVHFARLGTTVLADGPLWQGTTKGDQDDPAHFFQAEMEFVPTEGDCLDKENGVTRASLTGTAEIYGVGGVWVHDCSQEVEPKPANDLHCDL